MRAATAMIATLTVAGFVLGACKGETKIQDRPETLTELAGCEQARKDKEAYIKQLEQRVAELELKAGSPDDGEVVVTVAGDEITISGRGPNAKASAPKDPTGNADDKALYQAFLDSVNKSRGAMKKCYENALKKNTSLQARTVTLNVQVNFSSAGTAKSSSFNPKISDTFDNCMTGITQKWKLPAAPRAVTFKAPVTLSPQ